MDGSTIRHRLDRLTPLDVSNLRVEERGLPMHVAALAVLDGTPLLDASGQVQLDAVRLRLERRLHRAPRLCQKLHRPRIGLGPPVWVDDPAFDIDAHLRVRAVPAPGDEAALLKLCAELNQPPLHRGRPLWEMWLLPGLADGNVGLLVRFHHVVADGIAALEMIGALLDPAPDSTRGPTSLGVQEDMAAASKWTPRRVPATSVLLADNLARWRVGAGRALSLIRRPTVEARRLAAVGDQIRQGFREGLAPKVSFNRAVGAHRQMRLVRTNLDSVKTVAHAHGATVNDVVLAAVAGGARRLLGGRQELEPGLLLKATVAASIRGAADEAGGNRVAILLAPLPVGEPDPVRRLEHIEHATAERKRHAPYQPNARFAQRWMVRTMFHQRLVNVFTSNLRGPSAPLALAGARVLELFQVGVVQGNVTIAVGTLSYAGQLNINVVGDADAVPDLGAFAEGLADTLVELGIDLQARRGLSPRDA
ncbi:MAG TPA: wax ester/triacylglycerol synthase family O-acyltransferase [Jiangellaceae bacterium]|nr:wax ester/triacylglycerol synthase family O-acyltransferase [Jiangellaceae bacterium]